MDTKTFFAPHLTIRVLQPAVEFYEKAFSAILVRKWDNPDGTIHVAEMEIDGAIFHLHEEVTPKNQLSPETLNGTTLLIGLFSPDPDKLFHDAVSAGAIVVNPLEDYDYGYRQATVADPLVINGWFRKKFSPNCPLGRPIGSFKRSLICDYRMLLKKHHESRTNQTTY